VEQVIVIKYRLRHVQGGSVFGWASAQKVVRW